MGRGFLRPREEEEGSGADWVEERGFKGRT